MLLLRRLLLMKYFTLALALVVLGCTQAKPVIEPTIFLPAPAFSKSNVVIEPLVSIDVKGLCHPLIKRIQFRFENREWKDLAKLDLAARVNCESNGEFSLHGLQAAALSLLEDGKTITFQVRGFGDEFMSEVGYLKLQLSNAPVGPLPMVMIWKTDNISPGSSNANQARLPLFSDSSYDFVVDWGDGTSNAITSHNDPAAIHTYSAVGTYSIRLTGRFGRLAFNNSGDRLKILDVSQWGSNSWASMNSMFYGCENLSISATDSPDLSAVTDISLMFSYAHNFNQDIGNWDTSNITNMALAFSYATSFSQNINNWNTSNVTNMNYMFYNAATFNQDIGNWNTSNVTTMASMFSRAGTFNQNIGNWNTSNVTNMNYMFYDASLFNQDIGNWNTSQVTGMISIFSYAKFFNQDLSSWDVSKTFAFANFDLGATAWLPANKPVFP